MRLVQRQAAEEREKTGEGGERLAALNEEIDPGAVDARVHGHWARFGGIEIGGSAAHA